MSARRTTATALALAAALAVAGCGDSPEDTAHDQGKDVGSALAQLTAARSADELQAAATELKDAVGAVGDDVGDRARSQVSVQRDGLNQAIGDLRTALTSGDPDTAAAARTELQGDVQDLRSRASSFGASNDSVVNSFWDGVKDGYDDEDD
jgi:hypothetical protein